MLVRLGSGLIWPRSNRPTQLRPSQQAVSATIFSTRENFCINIIRQTLRMAESTTKTYFRRHFSWHSACSQLTPEYLPRLFKGRGNHQRNPQARKILPFNLQTLIGAYLCNLPKYGSVTKTNLKNKKVENVVSASQVTRAT